MSELHGIVHGTWGTHLIVLTFSMIARSILKVPSAFVSPDRFWKGMEMPFLCVETGVADATSARAAVKRVALQNMTTTSER